MESFRRGGGNSVRARTESTSAPARSKRRGGAFSAQTRTGIAKRGGLLLQCLVWGRLLAAAGVLVVLVADNRDPINAAVLPVVGIAIGIAIVEFLVQVRDGSQHDELVQVRDGSLRGGLCGLLRSRVFGRRGPARWGMTVTRFLRLCRFRRRPGVSEND